jgi:hypothetical protein
MFIHTDEDIFVFHISVVQTSVNPCIRGHFNVSSACMNIRAIRASAAVKMSFTGIIPPTVEEPKHFVGKGWGAMRRRLVSLLLALALLIAGLPGRAGAEPAAPPTPEEQAVLQELFTLGRSLDETRAAIDQANARLAELEGQRTAAAVERDRLEVRRRERQAVFGRRLRYYQEQGRLAPLAVLMGSSSFLDFLSRIDMLNQILAQDARLIAELRGLRAGVAEQEQKLRAAAEEQEKVRAALLADQAKLTRAIADREAILASLKEKRAAVEAELASLERVWEQQALPVLVALATTLQTVDPGAFAPDDISLSLFPPGATAVISSKSLNAFFGQRAELKGLTFQIAPAAVSLAGQFEGTPVAIGGQFVVAGKTVLRYEPKDVRIGDFAVPPQSLSSLLASSHIDIDVSSMISPWALKDVQMRQDELRIKAGIK